MSIIKKNFLYNLLLTVSTIIFPIITFPYASRILGPEGIGKVQFVTSFAQYFILIAALGIPVYGIREVAKRKNDLYALKQFFSEMLLLNIITAVLLSGIYLVVVYAVPSLKTDQHFYNVAVLMIVFSFCNIDWFFSGLERFKFIARRSLLVKFLGLILLFMLVKDRFDDIVFLEITVAIALLNNFWNLWSARSYFMPSSLTYQAFKIHARPMFYIFSTVAAISVYGFLDTVILGFIKGYEEVGYYAAASKITKITIPVLTSLGTVLIPKISQAFKDKNLAEVQQLATFSFDFVIVLGVPMCFGLIALAPELIVMFSGQAFAPAVLAMQIFSPVILIIGLSNVWAIQILTPAGKDRHVTTAVGCGVIVSVLLNFFLIPHFGYIGATIANVASEFVVMCGFAYFASFVMKQTLDYKLILQTLLISATFIPITWAVRNFVTSNNILICTLAICSCAIVYVIFQLFIIKNQFLISQIKTLIKKYV